MSNKIHKISQYHYAIADEGGWLPGAYYTYEAAELALKHKSREDWRFLQRLQDIANEQENPENRVISEKLILDNLN